MKTNLDYSTKIPHHDDESAILNISITNYQDGARMTISREYVAQTLTRINLNRKELESLLAILDRYDDAQKIMEGQLP